MSDERGQKLGEWHLVFSVPFDDYAMEPYFEVACPTHGGALLRVADINDACRCAEMTLRYAGSKAKKP